MSKPGDGTRRARRLEWPAACHFGARLVRSSSFRALRGCRPCDPSHELATNHLRRSVGRVRGVPSRVHQWRRIGKNNRDHSHGDREGTVWWPPPLPRRCDRDPRNWATRSTEAHGNGEIGSVRHGEGMLGLQSLELDERYFGAGDEAGTAPEDRRFRPDVEGLRAVAVLLVVLYHADVPRVTGGFVGVDVFLVISGSVITGVLLRNNEMPAAYR